MATIDPTRLRINSRRAEEIAEGQEAQHQQALQQNAAAGQVVQRQAAPVVSPLNQGVLDASQQQYQNQVMQPQPPVPAPITRGEELQQNAAARGQARKDGYVPLDQVDQFGWTPEQKLAAQKDQAVINTELMKQDKIRNEKTPMPATEAPLPVSGVAAGASAAFGQLPPEAKFLAPYFQQMQESIQASKDESATLKKEMRANIDRTYGGVEAQLNEMREGYKASTEAIQGILEDAKETNDQYLAEQKKAEDERFAWYDLQARRTTSKQKAEAHDTLVAQIALSGGFLQDANLREVMASDAVFEGRMADLASELSFKRTDLAAKFAGLYIENKNNYVNASIGNMKELQSSLERIGIQGISNDIARSTAEQGIVEKAWERQTALSGEMAKNNYDFASQIVTMIREEQSFKRADEQQAWNQLAWMKSTYGSNAPASLVKGIQDKLPGIDVAGLLSTPTLAEIKVARTGSGGGGGEISFSPMEMKSNGQPLGYEEFVKQKKAELMNDKSKSIQDIKKALDLNMLRAEYDAKKSTFSQGDPVMISLRLQDRIKNSPKNVRVNALRTVEDYLNKGMYADADRYVDGLGTPLSANERGDMIQALNAKKNIERIQAMLDEFGQQGPVTGRLKDFNLWSVQQAELNSIITQTVPGLARGIFKEVGVLTDSDIERYTRAIPNSKNTLGQSQALTRELLNTINMSIENQLAVMRDSGLNTRDLRERFETNGLGPNDAVMPTSADSDYTRSLGF